MRTFPRALDVDRLRRMSLDELLDWLQQLDDAYRIEEAELIEAHGITVNEFDRRVRRDVRHNQDASVRDAHGRD